VSTIRIDGHDLQWAKRLGEGGFAGRLQKISRKQLTEASAIFKKHLGEQKRTNGRRVFDVPPALMVPMA